MHLHISKHPIEYFNTKEGKRLLIDDPSTKNRWFQGVLEVWARQFIGQYDAKVSIVACVEDSQCMRMVKGTSRVNFKESAAGFP
jgi:hypothetical protein